MTRGRVAVVLLACATLAASLWWSRRGQREPTTILRTSKPQPPSTPLLWREQPAPLQPSSIAGRTKLAATPGPALVCAFSKTDGGLPPICERSSAEGEYRLVVESADSYQVVASLLGFESSSVEVVLERGEALESIDFDLERGGREVSGRVLDIAGGPIAGAVVFVTGDAVGGLAISDDEGRYRLSTAKKRASLHAEAEGYVGNGADSATPAEGIHISLFPAATLRGIVVRAGTEERIPGIDVWMGGSSATQTDGHGQFEIRGLEPGRFDVSAHGPGLFGHAASIRLGLAETSEPVRIEVFEALQIEGQVVFREDGRPCAKGSVSLSRIGDSQGPLGKVGSRTDAQGVARIDAVLPGRYEVDIDCDDAYPEESYPEIDVQESRTGFRWQVHSGTITVEGRVEDERGQPIAGAKVSISPGPEKPTRTDARGRFRFDGLDKGEHGVGASASGYYGGRTVDVFPEKGESVVVQLSRSATLAGRVTTEDGRPAINAGVGMRDQGEEETRHYPNGRVIVTSTVIELEAAKVGHDGTFESSGLEPKEYELWTYNEWWSSSSEESRSKRTKVVLEPGQTTYVDLKVRSESGTISGRVVDERGEGIADAFVQVDRAGDDQSRLSTDYGVMTGVDGEFEIGDVPDTKLALRAFQRGGGEARAEAMPGENPTLVIANTATLAGTARLRGRAPPWLTVRVDGDYVSRTEVYYRTGGKWQLEDLPPGRYSLSIAYQHYSATRELTLESGETRRDILLELEEPKADER